MPTSHSAVLEELALETAADWSVSHGRRFRANIIIWGMRKHYSTLFFKNILILIFCVFCFIVIKTIQYNYYYRICRSISRPGI